MSLSAAAEPEAPDPGPPTDLISQLGRLLSPHQRRQATMLIVALVGRALVQLLGVASIAPFMGIVADPTIIQSNAWLQDPEVLIFDETTSSLGDTTESAVLDAIDGLAGVTLIVIAHRLTSIERCDQILRIASGHLAP